MLLNILQCLLYMKCFIVSVYFIHNSHSVNRMKVNIFHVSFRRIIGTRSSFHTQLMADANFFLFRMAGMALVMRLTELFQGGTMRKCNFISFER